ncbi:MAG: HD domain-containing protein [Syntrophomonadaceae bacterium]|nr:HD domain-containing protein [Syntrophomonadaceae bacterium]
MMTLTASEKQFFLRNERQVNELVSRIMAIFLLVLCGLLVASYFHIFKVPVRDVLSIMAGAIGFELVLLLLLRIDAPSNLVKYYGVISIQFLISVMIANAYFGIYMCFILAPAISCLYFDRVFTRQIAILGYLMMLIALWFRAPLAIVLAFPGYTVTEWYIAFGLGYTLEYVALCTVLFALADRTRRYLEKLYERNERISDIQTKAIFRFADLIESRDDSTGKHVKRTSRYVQLLLEQMKQDEFFRHQLNEYDYVNILMAAPLHDIGKIKIPDAILLKPGKLTADEFNLIKRHSCDGGDIIIQTMDGIEQEDFVHHARDMARFHHEKWDGTGYPAGLSGEDIPISARVMAVADVFDALVSERCYKEAFDLDQAFTIMEEGKGAHFDPRLVDLFLAAREQVEAVINE